MLVAIEAKPETGRPPMPYLPKHIDTRFLVKSIRAVNKETSYVFSFRQLFPFRRHAVDGAFAAKFESST